MADLEVYDIELQEGETLHTKVILKDGRSYLVDLTSQFNCYKGSIRLAYQEDVSFQHLVMKGKDIILKTQEERLSVNYINRFSLKELDFQKKTSCQSTGMS